MTAPVSPAFAERLIGCLPKLRRYARALSGNAAMADDLVQNGIERALTRAHSLEQPERVGAWMRSIVHNLYVDELRQRRSRGVSVAVEDAADEPALRVADPGAREALGDVVRAMHGLSIEHRQILVLAGVEELTYREIADELAVPLGTVMSRLARARAALRLALETPAGSRRAGAAELPP